MEFTKSGERLTVESYEGVVDIAMSDTRHDSENNFLLSYAEWDDLVKSVEEARAKEKV